MPPFVQDIWFQEQQYIILTAVKASPPIGHMNEYLHINLLVVEELLLLLLLLPRSLQAWMPAGMSS